MALRDLSLDALDDGIQRVIRHAESQLDQNGYTGDSPRRWPVDATPVVDQEARAQRARFEELLRWGIPYQEAMLIMGHGGGPIRETLAVEAARGFMNGAGAPGAPNILVLAGPIGVGKTVASVLIAKEACPVLAYGQTWRDSQHPTFRHVTDLVNLGLYDEREERKRLAEAKVLVLDDIGVEYQDKGGVWLCFVDWILDKRYGAAGLTVITTNLTGGKFRSQYGERIYDRLRHRAGWWDIEGESLRGRP